VAAGEQQPQSVVLDRSGGLVGVSSRYMKAAAALANSCALPAPAIRGTVLLKQAFRPAKPSIEGDLLQPAVDLNSALVGSVKVDGGIGHQVRAV
jgi:hypothetical protein